MKYLQVHEVASGKELLRVELPHQEHAAELEQFKRENPDMPSYFFVNSQDYRTLKDAILERIRFGSSSSSSSSSALGGGIIIY